MLISQNGLIIIEKKMLFVDNLGWSHTEQMVTNYRMGAGVGHWEPTSDKGV